MVLRLLAATETVRASVKIVVVSTVCISMIASTGAAVVGASWTLPTSTITDPSQLLVKDQAFDSASDNIGWNAARNTFSAPIVSGFSKRLTVDFSYSAGQSALLNDSKLELTSVQSVLPAEYQHITNASWRFPTNTIPPPSQPLIADQAVYSIDDNLSWIAASTKLSVSFVPNPGATTALEFSYAGNHADYLNGSILKLSSTISGLPTGSSLSDIQLSYDVKWNMASSTIINIWSYSINGGAPVLFLTNGVSGNVWQTVSSPLAGLTLTNGETITLSDSIKGATGNNGSLDFDNLQITSNYVPEPSPLGLAALGIGNACALHILRLKRTRVSSRPLPRHYWKRRSND